MRAQNTNTQESRINIRVDGVLKKEAESIFKQIGLNMSDGINVYLRRVVAEKGIPFPLTVTRSQVVGEEAASMETAFARGVSDDISRKRTAGLPVAKYDAELRRPYMEYPDGCREYGLGE